jgi:hypothetical protein
MIWGDVFSAFIRQLTEFFGASHPIRLGVSVCLGVATLGALKICAPVFHHEAVTAAAELNAVFYIAMWGAIFFGPLVFGWKGAPDRIVNEIRKLRLTLDQTDFSLPYKRSIWRRVVEKQVEAMQSASLSKPTLPTLFEQAKAEVEVEMRDS